MEVKTKKRILFCISEEKEIAAAISFSNAIKKYFNEVETCALYVKDIKKYEIFQGNVSSFAMSINEYRDLEDEVYQEMKSKLKDHFDKVYGVRGDKIEVITEEMKAYDLLVLVRDKEELSSVLTTIIRTFYKSIMILHEEATEYNFDKILMLNDGGYMVNKSVFAYFNIFNENYIDVLRVNVDDRDRLSERFGKICNIIDETGDDTVGIINSYVPNYDIILMGGLNYPIFFERLTGHIGLKVIETSKKPIFIG